MIETERILEKRIKGFSSYYFEVFKNLSSRKLSERNKLIKENRKKFLDLSIFFPDFNPLTSTGNRSKIKIPLSNILLSNISNNNEVPTSEQKDLELRREYEKDLLRLIEKSKQIEEEGKKQLYLCYPFIIYKEKEGKNYYYTPIWLAEIKAYHKPEENCVQIEIVGETEFNLFSLSRFIKGLEDKEDIISRCREIDISEIEENEIKEVIQLIFNADPFIQKEDIQNKDLNKLEEIIVEENIRSLKDNTLYLANNLVICLLSKPDYHLEKALKELKEISLNKYDSLFYESVLYNIFGSEEDNKEAHNSDGNDGLSKLKIHDLILPANKEQIEVIKQALTKKVIPVEGPPGTGKSHTITNLALYLIKRGNKVLITSYKEKALEVLINFFEKLKIHNYLYVSWLKGDKKSRETILKKLENIQYERPEDKIRKNEDLESLIKRKEKLENKINEYLEDQRRFGYLYNFVFRNINLLNGNDDEIVKKFKLEFSLSKKDDISKYFIQSIQNLKLNENIEQQIEDTINSLKPKIRFDDNIDFETFIDFINLLGRLKSKGFFTEEHLRSDFEFLKETFHLFRNTYKEKNVDIKENFEYLLSKLKEIKEWLYSLNEISIIKEFFDVIAYLNNNELEILADLLEEIKIPIDKLSSNLRELDIKELEQTNAFLKQILKILNISESYIEDKKQIQEKFGELRNQLEDLKKLLTPPSGIKKFFYRLVRLFYKIFRKGKDPLEEKIIEFLNNRPYLFEVLKIESTEKLINDKECKRKVILKINDYLQKFNRLDKLSIFDINYEIDSILEKYENLIYEQELSSEYDECLSTLRNEVNRGLSELSIDRLENIYKIINILTTTIYLLLNKEENSIIKILLKTYGKKTLLDDLKHVFSIINIFNKIKSVSEVFDKFQEKSHLFVNINEGKYKVFYDLATSLIEYNIDEDKVEKFFISLIVSDLLESLEVKENIDQIQEEIKDIKKKIEDLSKKELSNYITESITNISSKYRRLIHSLKDILKSKKVKRIEEIKNKEDYIKILDIFRLWIVKIEDVFRIFPFKPAIFDYIIIDEASQVLPVYLLPLFFLTKRIIVVGDDKQLKSPELIFYREPISEQAFRENELDKDNLGSVFRITRESSCMQLSKLLPDKLLPESKFIMLKEHFRCLPEIIKFSNEKFYNGYLKIMTDGLERIGSAFEFHLVEGAQDDGYINKKEADELIKYLIELLKKPEYRKYTFGVLSFFRDQAEYLRDKFVEEKSRDPELYRIVKEKEEQNEPVIISTVDGFQGEERDIILYSLRYAPNSSPQIYQPILSEGNFGQNRLNVALTRARKKMIFFMSVDISNFPNNLLKDFLLYAKGYTESKIIIEEFDSDFERDVYERMKARGYDLYPQYPACGYRIDLALFIDNLRIGIECDGWQHYDRFGELKIEDIERQETLERAGWKILRIPSTKYWKDPEKYIDNLIEKINQIVDEHKRRLEEEKKRLEEEKKKSSLAEEERDEELELRAKFPEQIIGEEEMTEEKTIIEESQKTQIQAGVEIKQISIEDIKDGQYIIHKIHGPGIFRGKTIINGEEFLIVEFFNKDSRSTIYIPARNVSDFRLPEPSELKEMDELYFISTLEPFDEKNWRMWKRLSHWASKNKRLSPRARSFVYSIGDLIRRGKHLSENQKNWAINILKTAIKYGFNPQDEEEKADE